MKIPDDELLDEPTPNLTPLIDVVFLLLVFFMVSTTFLDPERELDIDLPQAESGNPVEVRPENIVINVHADGRLVLGTREVDTRELRAELERAAARDPETPVTIRGDEAASHGTIVGVMDACGLAGLGNLQVGTMEGS